MLVLYVIYTIFAMHINTKNIALARVISEFFCVMDIERSKRLLNFNLFGRFIREVTTKLSIEASTQSDVNIVTN